MTESDEVAIPSGETDLVLPTFIIGGTFPAGTGHLFSLIVQHPEIYLPLPMAPECNFFVKTRDYERGLGWYRERYFSKRSGERAIGERSSLMLSGPGVADRVARHLPDVKLIFLLRNPVDRAYANYRFTALAGHEVLPFPEALAAESDRIARNTDPFWSEIQPHAYFSRGIYAPQIETFTDRFPEDQLLLMRSDRLIKNPEGALPEILRFLDVDPTFVPEPAPEFSSPSVLDLATHRSLRAEAPERFDAAIQHVREGLSPRDAHEERVAANLKRGHDTLDPVLRQELTDRFRPYNLTLKDRVPFGIEDWL